MKKFINKKSIAIILIFLIFLGIILVYIHSKKETEFQNTKDITDNNVNNIEKPNTLGEIDLTAYDENRNLRSGATIILYDSAKNELGRSVTGRDGKINYYKVPEGAYKLIEVDDDEKEIQSKEIEVRAGEITKVDFTN